MKTAALVAAAMLSAMLATGPKAAHAQGSIGRATMVMTEEGGEEVAATPATTEDGGAPLGPDGKPVPVLSAPSNKWEDPWPNKPDDATHSSRVHPSGAYRMVYQAFTASECADIVKSVAHATQPPEDPFLRSVAEYKHIKDEEENRWIYHRVWGMAQEANSVQTADDCDNCRTWKFGAGRWTTDCSSVQCAFVPARTSCLRMAPLPHCCNSCGFGHRSCPQAHRNRATLQRMARRQRRGRMRRRRRHLTRMSARSSAG